LIRAVVESILSGGNPPPELKLARLCRKWETLPDAGGLYDQDYRTLLLMTAYTNIENTITRVRSLKGKDIHKLTEGERIVLKELMELGLLFK